jgi:peptide/nickel transport system substrate-binding protein
LKSREAQRDSDGGDIVARSDKRKIHPYIPKLVEQLEERRIDRREFLRTSTLLGLSATTAYGIVGRVFGESAVRSVRAQGTPQKGGILRVAMEVQKMDDPATYSWVQMSNQTRHTAEYLAITGPDNITRPMLAESWEASDDLKTWTFHLRQNVMWHNGEPFVADHVVWNVERWLDPDLGSSNIGLSTFASMDSVEAVDDHTVRFNLNKPVLSAPEDCYNYPTAILHPSFEPPFSDNPMGTGPYTLKEPLAVGDRCILRRITETTDGQPFKYWGDEPYLDEIHYYHYDADNQLTAFASGDVDTIYSFGIEQFEFAEALPGLVVATETAQTLCCRFKVTEPPFDNLKLRQALVKAADNPVYPELVFQGKSRVGENHHVSPIHPEYYPLPELKRDVEGAKALLDEAGIDPASLQLSIDVGNTDGPWHQTVCEIWRDQLKDIGVTLNINVMPASKYWEIWDKTPFGATSWTHRPLGTMVLSLGYRTGVPWNETSYANPEFDAALDEAEATLDVEARRAKMEKVEKILQDDAVMLQAVWRPVFTIITEQVRNYTGHPTQYHQFNQVWLET